MSDTVATAYADSETLQILLNNRISSTGLHLPVPTWFSTLRLTTKGLGRPSIDDAVCDALSQYVRTVNQANSQEEVQSAKEAAEKENKAARQGIATEEAEKRMFAAETREKIWRKQADKMTHMSVMAEKRIGNVHMACKKGVDALHKKLESLESRLKKARKDGDEEAPEQIRGDVGKMKRETDKFERIRVKLLEEEIRFMRAKNAALQHEKEKFEIANADGNISRFTSDTEKVEKLEAEIGVLREDRDITTGEKYSLQDRYAKLDEEHAQLEVEHMRLMEKYGETKATFDKAIEKARARKSGLMMAGSESSTNGETPVFDKGKKRMTPEDVETGGVEKAAKMDMEALAGMEDTQRNPELISRAKMMLQVQRQMESEPESASWGS